MDTKNYNKDSLEGSSKINDDSGVAYGKITERVVMTIEEKRQRIETAEKQINEGRFVSAVEAHRIMRSHILGLD